MTLQEKIDQDIVSAMKEKDEEIVSTLRMLKSALKNKEIELKKTLGDEETTQVIQNQIKSRKDSVDLYTKGNRPELAEKETKEIEILKKFLPEQMPKEEIRNLAQKIIQEQNAAGMQDMGKVMGAMMGKTKGKADGSTISKIVQELLS